MPAADLADLVRDLGHRGAVGLVVRAPVHLTADLAGAVEEAGLALLGLRRGATWAQLTALLRSLLAEGDIGPAEPESLGGLPSGDLFAVANAVAALLDAPVTIEDRSSRVLAFSGRQDEADPSRVETIIGRQVPEKYARMLTELGIFRELYRENRPVVVDPALLGADTISKQRVAIAVRAGDEVLGSIWAAMDGDVTPERASALQDAAKLVALHMLRVRAGADVQRRLRTDLVSTALEGGPGAGDALARLGLGGKQVVVLAVSLRAEPQADQDAAPGRPPGGLDRVADALAVHLSAVHAVIGGRDRRRHRVRPAPRARRRAGPRAAGRPVGRGLLRAAGHAAADRGGHRRGRVRRRRRDRVPGDGGDGPCECSATATPSVASRGCPTCTRSRSSSSSATWLTLAASGRWGRSPACRSTTRRHDSGLDRDARGLARCAR